jgi:SHS2 domain-containing protein
MAVTAPPSGVLHPTRRLPPMPEERSHFAHHEFLEHEADIGVRGVGDCWECAFGAAALALLEVMADPSSVVAVQSRDIEVTGSDLGALLVAWLNELLYLRDVDNMLFSSFALRISRESDGAFRLAGVAKGEELSPQRHGLKTEVKAATYSGLRCVEEGGRCSVQCLLDI